MPNKSIKYIFVVLGVVLTAVGVYLYVNAKKFVDEANEAAGKIVKIEKISNSKNNSDAYYPIVEFTTAENQTIKFKSKTGSNPPAFKIAEEVKVLYRPENPQNAEIKSFITLWFVPGILGPTGLIFTIIGLTLIILRIKKR